MDVRGKSSNDKRLIDADKMLEIYKKRKAYGYKWMWAGKLKEGQA